MKIRNDYVTNSSSSSFILSKKDGQMTKTDVFVIIKNFYQDFIDKRNALIKHINSNPELGLDYKEKEWYGHFCNKEGKWDKESIAIAKELENTFGISLWDNFDLNYDWFECQTYEEYEQFWLKKFEEKSKFHAPFTIGSFEEDEIIWLHWGAGKKDVHDTGCTSELIEWYYEFVGEECNNKCERCSVWKEDREECRRQHDVISSVETENLCLTLFGDFCIYSESGYIPDYVVKKLADITEFYCNHMG